MEPFAVVHEAMLAAARAPGVGQQLRALAGAPAVLAGGPTTVVVRDAMLAPLLMVQVRPAVDGAERSSSPARQPVPSAVWRRWVRLLKARGAQLAAPGASGAVYALDFADPWARAEFGQALCDPLTDGTTVGQEPTFAAAGLLVAPAFARDGSVLATLVQEVPGAWPPPPELVRVIEVIAQQVGQHVAEGRLTALAGHRAERLQRLQEAGAALARSLDESEIVRELARQVGRLVAADGVVVAHPELEIGTVRTSVRHVGGLSRPRAEQPLGAGPIAEAARTGAIVRVDDYDPSHSSLAAADDVVGEAGPAGSVLAAPMRVGTQLIGVVAVHAAARRAFGAADEELLRAVAAQAGTAIANARMFAASEAERRQSEALAEVARAVGGSLRFGEVMRLVLRHTSALLRARGACVALQRDDYLHVVAGVGAASLLSGVHVPVQNSLMGRTLLDGRPSISNDMVADERAYRPLQRVTHLENAVLVPLAGAAGPIGVIAAINRDAEFTEADARVLQRLADHVAVAIVNARLFEQVTTATREWKLAFDALTDGLVVVDEAGRVARCNQRAADLAGVAGPKALLGADFCEAIGIPALDVVERARSLGEAARDTVYAAERGVWFDVLAAPHPDGGSVITFDDVTADRARAAALARSEARYERLVEAATDVIFTADAEGRLTSVNHAAERATGRPREALVGASCGVLLGVEAVGDDDGEANADALAAALDGERVAREVRVLDARGAAHTYSLVATPIFEDDEVAGVLGVMRDVTDERRLGEQLLQREKLATVGRLVRGLAHELNNPLTSVLALADLLTDEAEDAPGGGLDRTPVLESAHAIRAEARRAARIMTKLHAFAEQRAPERAATDLNRVVLDALDLRRYALRTQEVDIAVDLDYELPVTWADPLQLQQVFVQIVTVAEHSLATVATGRRLTLRTRWRGDTLVASVADSAPFSEQAARRLEPFGPDDGDQTPDLAVSAEIVRAHGGRMRVEAAPGERGGVVFVELPFVPPPSVDDAKPARSGTAGGPNSER